MVEDKRQTMVAQRRVLLLLSSLKRPTSLPLSASPGQATDSPCHSSHGGLTSTRARFCTSGGTETRDSQRHFESTTTTSAAAVALGVTSCS